MVDLLDSPISSAGKEKHMQKTLGNHLREFLIRDDYSKVTPPKKPHKPTTTSPPIDKGAPPTPMAAQSGAKVAPSACVRAMVSSRA